MRFTREQLSIILAKDSKKLVNASAGTGKTFTLSTAVQREIRLDKEKKTKIAVFTFTNKAADELGSRLDVLPSFLGTIHSFSIKEIHKMEKEKLIISEIMSEDKMRRLLLNSYIELYGLNKHYKRELDEIYRYLTNREYIPDMAQSAKYKKVVKRYTKRKEELGLYDYMDAPRYLVEKLEEHERKLDYTHVFVDEVQDIDIWEFKLINSFAGNVFAIGDPRQSIYQFRNSTVQIFDKFLNFGYTLFELTNNFRSYQEILDNAGSSLIASRGTGGYVGGTELLYEEDVVILCRYNYEVVSLSNFFENVNTVHSYKGLESKTVFVVDFNVNSEEQENVMFVALTRARDKIGIGSFEEAMEIGRKRKYEL